MNPSLQKIQADFDRLALLAKVGWDHNAYHRAFLLKQIPVRLEHALEIGCGAGAFSRLLAKRAGRVLAIDLSPKMIEVARERSAGIANFEYQVADAQRFPYPPEAFDCMASIAAFHHLPLASLNKGDLCKAERT